MKGESLLAIAKTQMRISTKYFFDSIFISIFACEI